MAEDYTTRNDYLKALLNQKTALQQSGSLLNPSIQQPVVDTNNYAQNDSIVAKDTETDNILKNAWDDIVSLGENFAHGFLGSIEGIGDLALTIGSGIGGLFGADTTELNNFIAEDWSGKATGAVANAMTGNGFDTNWQSTLDTGFGQFMGGVSQSIGAMLPSILTVGAVGGAGALGEAGAKLLGTGLMSLGAAGGASQTALGEGASTGQALAYGLLSGAVEFGTEYMIPGSKAGGVIGGKVSKNLLKEIGTEMLEEGVEEVVSEMFAPLVEMTYKGTDALEQYSTPDFYKGVALSFASGAVTGGIMSGINSAKYNHDLSPKGVELNEKVQDISQRYSQQINEYKASNGAIGTEQLDKITENYTKEMAPVLKDIGELPARNRDNLVKMWSNPEAYKSQLKEAKQQGIVSEFYDQRFADFNSNMTQSAEDIIKRDIENLFYERTGKLSSINTPTETEWNDMVSNPNDSAFVSEGQVFINPKYKDQFSRKIVHELIWHNWAELDTNARNRIVSAIENNAEFKSILNDVKSNAEYQEQAKTMKNAEEFYNGEAAAAYLEQNAGNISDVEKLLSKRQTSTIKGFFSSLFKKKATSNYLQDALDSIKYKQTSRAKLAYSALEKGGKVYDDGEKKYTFGNAEFTFSKDKVAGKYTIGANNKPLEVRKLHKGYEVVEEGSTIKSYSPQVLNNVDKNGIEHYVDQTDKNGKPVVINFDTPENVQKYLDERGAKRVQAYSDNNFKANSSPSVPAHPTTTGIDKTVSNKFSIHNKSNIYVLTGSNEHALYRTYYNTKNKEWTIQKTVNGKETKVLGEFKNKDAVIKYFDDLGYASISNDYKDIERFKKVQNKSKVENTKTKVETPKAKVENTNYVSQMKKAYKKMKSLNSDTSKEYMSKFLDALGYDGLSFDGTTIYKGDKKFAKLTLTNKNGKEWTVKRYQLLGEFKPTSNTNTKVQNKQTPLTKEQKLLLDLTSQYQEDAVKEAVKKAKTSEEARDYAEDILLKRYKSIGEDIQKARIKFGDEGHAADVAETLFNMKKVSKEKAKTTTPNLSTVDNIKNYAKANYLTFETVKSSNEVSKKLVAMTEAFLAKDNVQIKANLSEELFKDYNTVRKAELKGKLNELTSRYLDSQVVYLEGEKDVTRTIKEILNADGVDVKEFSDSFSSDMERLLTEKSTKSKMGKLNDFLRDKISFLEERIKYYREEAVSVVKTSKLINKVHQVIDSQKNLTNLLDQTGLSSINLQIIKNTLSKRDIASETKKGFSPAYIANTLNNIDWYNEKTLMDNFAGYKINQTIEQYIKELKGKLSTNKAGKVVFDGNKQVSLEDTNKFHAIVKEVLNVSRSIYDEASRANKMALHAQNTEWNVIKQAYDVSKNKVTNFVSDIFMNTSSPSSTFAKYFGRNSKTYKTLYTDIVSSHSQHMTKMVEFKNNLLNIANETFLDKTEIKKFRDLQKVQDKMSNAFKKKVSFSAGGKTYEVDLGTALDIYMESMTTQGYATLKRGGYSYNEGGKKNTLKFTPEEIEGIAELISDNGLSDFADRVSKEMYNGEFTKYKGEKDVKYFGLENIITDRVYYPNNKDITNPITTETREVNNYQTDPSQWDSNKINKNDTRNPIKGMSFEDRFDNYISSLTIYGEMYQECKNFDTLVGIINKGGKANNYIKGISRLLDYYSKQITGQDVNESKIGTGGLYSNIVNATLAGNVSVVLKQTASLPTIMNEVSLKSFIKGLSGITNIAKTQDIKTEVSAISGMLATRFGSGEALTSETLTKTISRFAKIFGVPMEFMDSAVILTVGYRSAQFEAQANGYGELGSKTNTDEAVKILERIVAKTQSNSQNLEISMARSGYSGTFYKVLSVFSSDLQNKISYINELFEEKKYAGLRIDGSNKYIAELTENINNTENDIKELEDYLYEVEDDNEMARIQKEIDSKTDDLNDYKKQLDETEVIKSEAETLFNDKERGKRISKLFVSMAMSGLIIAGVEQLVSRLLGRKDWEEDDKEEFAKTLLLESTVFNLPFVSQIYNAIDYDSNIELFDLGLANEALDLFRDMASYLEGDKSINSLIVPAMKTVGDLTGVPLYNLYNLTAGITKNINYETGTGLDAVVRSYSSSYIMSSYKDAVKNKGTSRANGLLSYEMTAYKAGKADSSVVTELTILYGKGFNAIPSNVPTTYKADTGEETDLSEEQIGKFKTMYQKSNDEVKNLISSASYRNSSDEDKSKLISKIYNAYYSASKAVATGDTDNLSKLGKIIYLTGGNVTISKYAYHLSKISELNGKESILKYVNKASGLTREEKIILMYLAGYSVSGTSATQLKNYLIKKGAKYWEISKLLNI